MIPAEAQEMLRTAAALFRAGRMAEAVPAYERLLARWPALPDSWFNLAIARRAVRDFAGALAAYGEALAHGMSGAEEAHVNRATILSDDLGDPDGARAELVTALTIAPGFVPALLNLGNLCEDRGDRIGAVDAYERVLAAEPGNVLALCRLVGVAELDGTDDARLARLNAVARSAGPDPVRADAAFALGAALDRLGAYDRAATAFAAANEATARWARAAGVAYDPSAMTRFVDLSIAAFAKPEPRGGGGGDLVFVCGMLRSGSTLVERILAAHPQVDAGGEIAALPALAATLRPYPQTAATASEAILAELRERYRAEVASRNRSGAVLTDKRPDNVLYIGLIKRLFPDAKIVWTTRDARDNGLSVYVLHAAPELAWATDLRHVAQVQREQARLMAHWRALYPDDIREVRYETLVANPVGQVADLLAFLGLPGDPTLHERFVAGGAVRTASHWQVRRALNADGVGRWRNYPTLAGLPDRG